jgi:N-acetylmuramoyl-L-alanine amidase
MKQNRWSRRLSVWLVLLLVTHSLCSCQYEIEQAFFSKEKTTDESPISLITKNSSPIITTDQATESTTSPIMPYQTESNLSEALSTVTTENLPILPPQTEDIADEDWEETREIVYALLACRLYQNTTSLLSDIEISKDDALLCVGRGENWCKILHREQVYYLPSSYLTNDRPASAQAISAEKGGIYYQGSGKLVAIDAGHQKSGMTDTEPIGPGAEEKKAKLTTGAMGVATGITESQLNLTVSLFLRDELISRGYSVVMIRESQDVTLSNAQRAVIANHYLADAFVRIHANSVDSSSAVGALTICQTVANPYNGNLYTDSRRLSEEILSHYCQETGIQKRSVTETDSMTGINWSEVPATILEMGFLSNAEEDLLLSTEAFQMEAAKGIADGLDSFFTD